MNKLQQLLIQYNPDHSGEQSFKPRFLTLLEHPRAFYRDHLPGHITGSAWIVDETFQYTLLAHHAKLNRWLQPGGHADGDEDVLNVALREAQEETGLKKLSLYNKSIFDIDIHTIPPRKDFPEHEHYDVRFLFIASRNEPLILTEESHALQWVDLQELETISQHNESMLRMAAKCKTLFRADQQ